METVMPVRSLLLLTVRKASEIESFNCMPFKKSVLKKNKTL
jgi:hypothetical protein